MRKYGYVFQSPLLVALSIIHSLLIFAFLISYLLEPDPTLYGEFGVLYTSSTGWIVFLVIAGILVGIPHVTCSCALGCCNTFCILLMFIVMTIVAICYVHVYVY